ncbi:rubrerythrin family protein [Salipaludibacillus neizhouensis]|uniref:Rubrerythrin family protein n=1 Tax=Salipaludibacillus neizhouensis TaxID=885475 RepID=A0A3A9K1P0_9BACI|nr:ferritin-like domain-containing protein [Salipaludibacillus neizhouensis]RKL66279.1 rubrerythrin family protein [Salipaludibacillus neizhouensis]
MDQPLYYYNYNPYDGYFRGEPDTHLVNDIQTALNGELRAFNRNENLINKADTKELKKRIAEMQKDEQDHIKAFRSIYSNLTGRQPTIEKTVSYPKDLIEGLESAFKEEQETVDFYLDIADRAQDMKIKEMFGRAASNKQNHAVWLLYYFHLKGH